MSNETLTPEKSVENVPIIDILNSSPLWIAFIIIGIIASILGVVYIVYSKLKIKINEISFGSFFNADDGSFVQDRMYGVKWGNAFKRKIFLPHKTDQGSIVNAWYKPTTGPLVPLNKEHYEEIIDGSKTKIHLADKEFFKTEEIERFRIKTTTTLDPNRRDQLLKNVQVDVHEDRLIIQNNNEEEVRNFPVDMPDTVPPEKGFEYINTIDNVVTYRAKPDTSKLGVGGEKGGLIILINIAKNSLGGRLEIPILS